MRKEVMYLVAAILIALAVMTFSYWSGKQTGLFIFGQYENQTDCENSCEYLCISETNTTCTDIPDCTLCTEDCLESCQTCENITTVECSNLTYTNEEDCIGEGFDWTNETNTTCTDIPDCTLCTEDCLESCQTCENITTWKCVGDICDSSHLDLCLSEDNCTTAGGYWYDDSCNEDECSSDSHCESGYECSGGNCVQIEDEASEEDSEETESDSESMQSSITSQTITPPITKKLLIYDISDLELVPSESKEVTLDVGNTGTEPLSACKIYSAGELSSWTSMPEDSKNLNPGDEVSFDFVLHIPEDTIPSDYVLSVLVECFELSQGKEFTVKVVKKTFEFSLKDVRKVSDNEVRAKYLLSDLSGSDQNVHLNFALLDNKSQKVSEVTDVKNLSANLSEEFYTLLAVNEIVEGNLTLTIDLNTETYSSSVQEPIVLTAPSILGFAIFDRIGGTGSAIILFVVVLSLIFAIMLVRKIRKAHKNKNS